MNLAELQQALAALLSRSRLDPSANVGIQTVSTQVCHAYISQLASVSSGSDWTNGMVILHPSDHLKLVPAELKEPARKVAADRLAALREGYQKSGFSYDLPKAREGAWIDGFVAGLRMI